MVEAFQIDNLPVGEESSVGTYAVYTPCSIFLSVFFFFFNRFPLKWLQVRDGVSQDWFMVGMRTKLPLRKPEHLKDFPCSLSPNRFLLVICRGRRKQRLVEGRMDRPMSCLLIHWSIDWLQGAVPPRVTNLCHLCYFIPGASQTECGPHLCVFAMQWWMRALAPAQRAQIKILALNKRPRPARCAPVIIRSLQRERTRWPSGLRGGWGGVGFSAGTYPAGLTPPLLHQEFPSSQRLFLNEFTEY